MQLDSDEDPAQPASEAAPDDDGSTDDGEHFGQQFDDDDLKRVGEAISGKKFEDIPVIQYVTTVMLLSRVVRNSELLDDAALKLRAVDTALSGWSSVMMLGDRSFENLSHGRDEKEEVRAFNELNEKDRAGLERMMKSATPTLSGFALYDAIGTILLGKVFEEYLESAKNKCDLQAFLVTCILLYMSVFDGYSGRARAFAHVKRFIVDKDVSLTQLWLLFEALSVAKGYPGLSETNADELEAILAEIYLALNGVRRGPQSPFGILWQRVIDKFKQQRRSKGRDT